MPVKLCQGGIKELAKRDQKEVTVIETQTLSLERVMTSHQAKQIVQSLETRQWIVIPILTLIYRLVTWRVILTRRPLGSNIPKVRNLNMNLEFVGGHPLDRSRMG